MQNSGLGTERSLQLLLGHTASSPDVILSDDKLPPSKDITEDLGILDLVG